MQNAPVKGRFHKTCGTSIQLPNPESDTDAAESTRREKRCPVSLKVQYHTAKEFKTDYTRNVSRGGMFLATTSPIKVGTGMYLEMFLPDLNEPIRLSVVVVHSQLYADDKKEPGIGVEFIDIDPLDRSKLINYLNSIPDCG
jgi:type IV pilus assembly protein PilZ